MVVNNTTYSWLHQYFMIAGAGRGLTASPLGLSVTKSVAQVKNYIFVWIYKIWDYFVNNLYFVNELGLINKSSNLKFLLHKCDTYSSAVNVAYALFTLYA